MKRFLKHMYFVFVCLVITVSVMWFYSEFIEVVCQMFNVNVNKLSGKNQIIYYPILLGGGVYVWYKSLYYGIHKFTTPDNDKFSFQTILTDYMEERLHTGGMYSTAITMAIWIVMGTLVAFNKIVTYLDTYVAPQYVGPVIAGLTIFVIFMYVVIVTMNFKCDGCK
ncbi:MAG: hypothetical protein ACRC92_26635 [Peptostreptococcaceae bacterium]